MSSDDSCTPSGGPYPSDCEITQGYLEKARARQQGSERGYVWKACLPKAAPVKLLLLDVDGVLTDGSLLYSDTTEIKSFHSQDGFGIRLLREAGIAVGIITARQSAAVTLRAKNLALDFVFQNTKDKLSVYEKLLQDQQLSAAETAYVGDDWLDLALLARVGFSASVANGNEEVKKQVHYVAQKQGGQGAVREICELILDAKGLYPSLLKKYLGG